ncbi:MAG TPA: 3-hydroxyacyl-CoA dehydrogenase family protein, partial [Gemmatimonadaceae bacterium]|nr:3-hydroxyacyl-CoA dehydrogenase family protein [Gemmatimonadaceae bacterium]
MTIRRVAVIGAGTMGHGIAYVACAAGYDVRLADADAATLATGMRRIQEAFDKAIERGKATPASRDAGLARLTSAASAPEAAQEADLVIEAVPERLELKQSIFRDLERSMAPTAILGSNTSSLSITRIAEGLRHEERVVGLHFFNPVPVMKLLEIVRGERTSDKVVDAARAFATSLGKTPIVVRDSPGFATSRLGVVLGLEAIRMLEQGVASAEDIDRAMELGYNHPMGPLRLTDVVGLDVRLAIAEHLHATLGDETYEPPALLRRLVSEGKLGKKSGQGFYSWE